MSRSVFAGLLLLSSACFEDPGAIECPAGSQGCPCLDLQCEAGLVCQGSRCEPEGDTDPGGSTTSPATTGTTAGPSTTAPDDDSTSSGSDPLTTGTVDSTAADGSSGTTGPICGDGIVDPSEPCDSALGCTDCMLDNYECNPLNNAPCPDTLKCSLFEDDKGVPMTSCLAFLDPPPGQLFESNCYEFYPRDEWCDLGLACAPSSQTDACEVNCCVEFCDLTDPSFTCAFPGDTCQPILGGAAPSGLETLGFCITP